MKRRGKKHDRRPLEERLRGIQVATLDKAARKYGFDITETGAFEFTVRPRNTESRKALAEVSRNLEPGADLGMGAIVLAALGMCLFDEKYERLTLEGEHGLVGEATETGRDRFSIKFTHKPTTDLISEVAARRNSTHADALSMFMRGAAATLELNTEMKPSAGETIH